MVVLMVVVVAAVRVVLLVVLLILAVSSISSQFGLVVNTLVSINIVTLRQAWLVPGWVTILGRVNHLGTEPGTQVNSARAVRLWVGTVSTQQKLGVNRHIG